MMPRLVIVEQLNQETWNACFEDLPGQTFTGTDAESAIVGLLNSGVDPVYPKSIYRVDNGTKQGHFVYEVTFKDELVSPPSN